MAGKPWEDDGDGTAAAAPGAAAPALVPGGAAAVVRPWEDAPGGPPGPPPGPPQPAPGAAPAPVSLPDAGGWLRKPEVLAGGLARGVIGTAGVPGDLEALARAGVNWLRPGTLAPETRLPTAQDVVGGAERLPYVGGVLAATEPRTPGERYWSRAGEFIGAAAVPTGLGAAARGAGLLREAAPAIANARGAALLGQTAAPAAATASSTLGTLGDLGVQAARAAGAGVGSELAMQAYPDHPWVAGTLGALAGRLATGGALNVAGRAGTALAPRLVPPAAGDVSATLDALRPTGGMIPWDEMARAAATGAAVGGVPGAIHGALAAGVGGIGRSGLAKALTSPAGERFLLGPATALPPPARSTLAGALVAPYLAR